MIIGYHSIFGMYGFWLPNDPRGSGSDYVASWELFRHGAATKVASRRSVAHLPLPPNWQRGQDCARISAGRRKRPPSAGDKRRICHGGGRRSIPRLRLRDSPRARAPRDRCQCAPHPRVGRSFSQSPDACFAAAAVMGRRPAALGRAWLECLSGIGRGRRAGHPLRQWEPIERREEAAELVFRRALRGA